MSAESQRDEWEKGLPFGPCVDSSAPCRLIRSFRPVAAPNSFSRLCLRRVKPSTSISTASTPLARLLQQESPPTLALAGLARFAAAPQILPFPFPSKSSHPPIDSPASVLLKPSVQCHYRRRIHPHDRTPRGEGSTIMPHHMVTGLIRNEKSLAQAPTSGSPRLGHHHLLQGLLT